MKRTFTNLISALALLVFMAPSLVGWGQAPVNTTLWKETWTDGTAFTTPSDYNFSGTTVYGGATLTYAQSSTATKLYAEELAGGSSPELLLSKSNQTWTISNIPTGQATGMSLTFFSNKTTFDVTSTTVGITISGSQKSWTITATSSVENFNLTIKNTGSSNARIDNILLNVTTAGGSNPPTPTTYTVTYDCNGGTIGCPSNLTGVEAGTTITLANAPTKTDYDFAGWNDGNNTYEAGDEYTVNGDVTFTAQWTEVVSGDDHWVLTDLADLTADDVFVIVGNNGSNYAMSNDKGTGNPPTAVAVTVTGNEITGTVAANIQWNISGNATNGYTFYPNGSTTTWLYCTNTNNGVRVGTNDNKTFKIDANSGYLKHDGTSRFVGIYNSADWRCYTSAGGNIANQTFAFYKKVTGGVVPPSITAANVDIEFNAISGSITYTINNGVEGGTVTAATESDWLTLGNGTTSPISFTCTANEAGTARTATVTLTYTYNRETVTKDVTVTQAAAPVVYNTMQAIFDKATEVEGTATSVNIALQNWVVSGVSTNGKNVFVTDGTKGFVIYNTDGNMGFAVGNVLSGTVSCKVQLYHGFAEITELNSSTEGISIATGGTVTEANIAMADLAGVNTGALMSYENLTCSVTTSGNNTFYNLSDGTTTIQVYNTLYAFGTLTDGKTYNITGIYQQYNNTKEILPRSTDDIEEVVSADPSVTVTPNMINAPSTGVDGTLAITYENIPDLISFDIQFCDANGDELTGNDPEWIDAEIQEENDVYSVYYVVDANDGDARTAYFKVYTLVGNNLEEVYAIVTVSQAKYVVDYATLPFSFNGGRADIENTNGLTQEGLDSDYGSSPKLKFNGTGDWVILQINERPGILTFDILGNSFSGGTFKVQTSVDGQTYTDLTSYTSLSSNTLSESFNNLSADVRYIKWIYTEKSSGNVALGNITLAKYVEPVLVASITVDPSLVNVNADEHDGTLALTYENLTIDDMTDFSIQHYNAQGEEISQPVWIEVLVAEQDPAVGEGYVVSYYMLENDGAARTAYFKVFAAGDEDFVYSNLVTVTQAAPVVDYALLPFEFDGGRAAIAGTNGLTQEGLDTDYASSPKLKFNNTGDWLILKLNSAPAAITFDIQGNSFSDGTFTVQTSNDGTTYTNLGEYTELGTTQTVTLINTNDAVRFVKWVYTEKVNGNVGLGKIIVTKAMPFDGNTTLTPSTFDPEKNHSYIVGDGATLTLDGDFSNILNEPNYLIIEDGGQVIVNNSGVQATVMKSVAHNTSKDADNWYTISSPVNNPAFANVTNLIQEPAANYDLYRYNETSMIWENKKAHTTDFTSLENGRGYLYWNSTGAELSFAGELNAADVTYHLTYGAEKDNLKGFNLIGNPFPHNIYKGNGAAICDSRLTSGFYVLNNASGWSANPEAYTTAITPGQGILVQTTAAFDLTITNTNAEATTAKSESNDLISFTVANDKYEDVAYVQFKDAIGLNKIEHLNAEIPMLYIFDEGSEFAIANLDRNTKGFDLNFEAATDGEYTVSAKAMGDFEYFHLIDRLAGNDIDMLSEGKYTFTAKKDDIKFRFYVKLSEKSNNSNAENDNFAFISNGQIILNGVNHDATIQVIDMLGRVVSSQTVNGNSTHMAPTASGVYVLRLIDGTNVMTQKIVVK